MRPSEVLQWLDSDPPLEELCDAYPQDWLAVERDVGRLLAAGDTGALEAHLAALATPLRRSAGHALPARKLLSAQIRRQMTVAALKRAHLAASTGVASGRVRFNLINGFIAQRLLFEHDLVRKPASRWLFGAVWPLLWQRRLLMPLVHPKGIYCFYTKQFIAALTGLIAGRKCLEIGAGDGTLARFLTERGVEVTATDDYSWERSIEYPEHVLRQDAVAALRRHQPEVVLCSWPPAGNSFEEHVFRTPSVQLYVVVAGGDEGNAGNWPAYRRQAEFDYAVDPRLSRLVLPPEISPTVVVFRRR